MSTRRRKPNQAEDDTFTGLMARVGKTPAMIEVETGVSVPTVYRAKRGDVPRSRALLSALARAVCVTEDECREAIERGRAA